MFTDVAIDMSDHRLITEPITREELRAIAHERFGDLVKAVVDIEQQIMVVGGELHADGERALLDRGSRQEDLWGINLYPDASGDGFIEYDSMINLRPRQGNRSHGVEYALTRQRVRDVVRSFVRGAV